MPARHLMNVVFPQPLGPIMATYSPSLISMLTLSRATTSPYFFARLTTLTAGALRDFGYTIDMDSSLVSRTLATSAPTYTAGRRLRKRLRKLGADSSAGGDAGARLRLKLERLKKIKEGTMIHMGDDVRTDIPYTIEKSEKYI